MKNQTLTPTTIKQNNQSKIYHIIYQEKQISKQEIADKTGISLPTIASNLENFEKHKLIKREDTFASTGGRKAKVIACNPMAKIAIGVEISATFINIVAIDLYGDSIKHQSLAISFYHQEAYYQTLATNLTSFMKSLPKKNILGIGIAIQGLVSKDGATITYGKILNCTGLHIDTIAKYLKYPCIFIHDAKAAAIAELWFRKEQVDAMYLSLSRNLGGAILLNNQVYEGNFLPGGLFEHMVLVDDGKLCYCGNKGCLEAYCGANVLLQDFDTLEAFFDALHNNDKKTINIWHDYLHYLAIAIHNIAMVLGCHIILGGQLSQYLTTQDIAYIKQEMQRISAFHEEQETLILARCTTDSIVVGAALPYIKDFLNTI